MERDRRSLILGVLLALLLARGIRALFSTAFYESLITLRLNESALWMLALAAPLLAPALGPRALRAAAVLAAIATAALPWTRFTDAHLPTAALATGSALLALALAARAPRALAGALAGLALDAAFLTATSSRDPLADGAAPALLLVALGIAAVVLTRGPTREPPAGRGTLAGLGLGALLVLELTFLLNPFALARWAGVPAWAAALAALTGLLVGALARPPRWLLVVGVVGLVDLVFFQSPVVVLSIAAIQLALGRSATRLAPGFATTTGILAFTVAFGSLAFVLLFFRDPLGLHEWRVIMPSLAAAPLLAALRPRGDAWRPRASRPASAMLSVPLAALVLVAAWPQAIADAPEGPTFTIVTYNLHQGFGNRGALDPEIHRDILRSLDADVVVLQETDTTRLSSAGLDIARYLADTLNMRAAYGRSGVAVLSRFPLADIEPDPATAEQVWFFETGLETPAGTLWIHGVHLARSREERARQADLVLAAADARPGMRIVAGDLNACPSATCFGNRPSDDIYDKMTARYQDAWVAAGHARDDPAGNTIHARAPSRRIDLVLVEGIEVLDARVARNDLTRLGSDHLPVVATLRLPRE